MSGEVDRSQYVLPLDQPVVTLDVSAAFSQLSTEEKLYSYYLSRASWFGGLITLLQTSPESGALFCTFHKLFTAQSPKKFKAAALSHGFSEKEVTAVLVYAAGIFTNAGNYKGFGDTKFIPAMDPVRFEEILKLSPVWPDLQQWWYWFDLQTRIFDLRPGRTCLGYPPHGCSTYFSANFTPADNENIQNWMTRHSLEAYNSRCFKTEKKNGQIEYEIRLAAKDTGEIQHFEEGRHVYRLVKGDYSLLLARVAQSLEKAIPFANQLESLMLQAYIRSFKSGSLNEHKQGSRLWVQNKSPAIESYIGFIETYRDPAGVRGEFEGFVAAVNRPMSKKFTNLVKNAERLLAKLPWPKNFEKDEFLRPDFTSLDVLTFAGSGIPAGINIPNYDEIRQNEGFKNVSLGNVIPASYQSTITPFLSEEDAHLLKTLRVPAFELQVGLHELLGHGSGKLLRQEANGSLNYSRDLVNPLTGNPISSNYKPGETYDSRFGPLSSSYEECRAEAVGLYLSLESSVLEIFGHVGPAASDVCYVNWLSLVWAGAGRSLEMWDPNRGWLQAHAQARFVLMRVLVQAGVAKVLEKNHNLRITLDRSALAGVGRNAIAHFLLQLQVHKATGDSEAAEKLFSHYSDVVEPWLSWRTIVLAHKQPRNMLIQPNILLSEDQITLRTYSQNMEGLIQSWVDRFPDPELIYLDIIELSRSDLHHYG